MYCSVRNFKQRIPNPHHPTRENLLQYLRDRESGLPRNRDSSSRLPPFFYERQLYKFITPNLSILNVETSFGYMRKFTPDGHLMLSFSYDLRSLVVLTYLGAGKAASLVRNIEREFISNTDTTPQSIHIRKNVFNCLFRERFKILLSPESNTRAHLHREFSIFMEDGRYVLVVVMGFSEGAQPVEYYWKYPDLYDQVEIFSYNFFLIDLKLGVVSDTIKFPHDHISVSHNQGVSVYKSIIAVLSRHRQCITFFELVSGKFHKLLELGPFGDELCPDSDVTLHTKLPLPHLKQRVLTCLYLQILKSEGIERRVRLRNFYKNFPLYERMLLDKVQMLNNEILMLRFEERKNSTSSSTRQNSRRNPDNEFKIYAFYSLSLDRILKAYYHDSVELLHVLRDYCDHFRSARSVIDQSVPSSPSNCEFCRGAFNHVTHSLSGGEPEAALRFNVTLPISTQSYAVTHYLCCNLFDYDERLISPLERPKVCLQEPINFFDRETNRIKFRVHLVHRVRDNGGHGGAAAISRELVAYIFHPYEPFIISIQKFSTRYIVNFHIHNKSTIVTLS